MKGSSLKDMVWVGFQFWCHVIYSTFMTFDTHSGGKKKNAGDESGTRSREKAALTCSYFKQIVNIRQAILQTFTWFYESADVEERDYTRSIKMCYHLNPQLHQQTKKLFVAIMLLACITDKPDSKKIILYGL